MVRGWYGPAIRDASCSAPPGVLLPTLFCTGGHPGLSCLTQTPGTNSVIPRQRLLSLVLARGSGVHPSAVPAGAAAGLGRGEGVEGSLGSSTAVTSRVSPPTLIFSGVTVEIAHLAEIITLSKRQADPFFNQI